MDKLVIKIFFLSMACLTVSGCDVIYGFLHKEGAQEKELIGESVPFEKNPTIQEIQYLLQVYGYNPGRPDGVMGAKTRYAIERFQKDNALEVSRFVDDLTWEKLKLFKDTPFIKNNQLDIAYVQSILSKAGYSPGSADGKMGERTKLAILKFQKEHKLKPDGRVGYKTLIQLLRYVTKE